MSVSQFTEGGIILMGGGHSLGTPSPKLECRDALASGQVRRLKRRPPLCRRQSIFRGS